MIRGRKSAIGDLLWGAVVLSTMLAGFVPCCQARQAAGQITGTIRDSEGKPIPDAVVVLSARDGGFETMRGTADLVGKYVLSDVPYGTYKLSARAQGYRDAEPKLIIVSPAVRAMDLVLNPLERSAGPEPGAAASLKESKQAPEFSPAGIRGTIAPSGYSTGLSSEETAQVNHNVGQIGAELFAALMPAATAAGCNEEPRLRRALEEDPKGFGPNHDLGLFYMEHGDFGQSIQYLDIAHAASPEDQAGSRDLALALLGAGRDAEAIMIAGPLANSQHKDPAATKILAMAYEGVGEAEKSKAMYRQAASLDPSPKNQFDCGMGLVRLGAVEGARTLFSAATTAHPESARLWMGLGITEGLLQHKPAAVQNLMRAVEKDPEYFPPYSFLADLADSVPAEQEPIRNRLAEFVVAHPETAAAHLDYALALWKQSRRDTGRASIPEIVAQLKTALEKDPELARAHFALGEIYSDDADLPRAELEFRAVLAQEPENAQGHYRLSQMYRREGKKELADEEIEKFRSLHGKPGEGDDSRQPGLPKLTDQPFKALVKCPSVGK